MALTISKLAAGSLPVIEKEIPLLKDTVKIQLLSRKRRREIYPDQTQEEIDRRNQPIKDLDEKIAVLTEELALCTSQLAKLADLPPPLSEGDSSTLISLEARQPALNAELAEKTSQRTELLKKVESVETERVIKFLQACLTDDTGDFMTDEQAAAMVNDTINELALLEIMAACQEAHGMKTLTAAEMEGDQPGE